METLSTQCDSTSLAGALIDAEIENDYEAYELPIFD
jgi:hypothetical protein